MSKLMTKKKSCYFYSGVVAFGASYQNKIPVSGIAKGYNPEDAYNAGIKIERDKLHESSKNGNPKWKLAFTKFYKV